MKITKIGTSSQGISKRTKGLIALMAAAGTCLPAAFSSNTYDTDNCDDDYVSARQGCNDAYSQGLISMHDAHGDCMDSAQTAYDACIDALPCNADYNTAVAACDDDWGNSDQGSAAAAARVDCMNAANDAKIYCEEYADENAELMCNATLSDAQDGCANAMDTAANNLNNDYDSCVDDALQSLGDCLNGC
jgi:hypothetical protein